MESKIKMESKILIERYQDDETNKNENFKKYIFKNLNFSIINGLRRTIISDIPVWCFNGLPNLIKDNNINTIYEKEFFNLNRNIRIYSNHV